MGIGRAASGSSGAHGFCSLADQGPNIIVELFKLPQAVAVHGDALFNVRKTSVVVAENGRTPGLAFQLSSDQRPPTWPSPAVLQQMHLDVMVENIAEATPRVVALGASKLDGKDVFADPAGHPFCLIQRPGWAEPVGTETTVPGRASRQE